MASEREFTPARLEAISDGVIAVAITIMVLELHAPKEATIAALLALWPQFAIYLVSFLFLATYWVNHRFLFSLLRRVDERVLWGNMGLLFLLSLIPFATAYCGQTRLAAVPTALYAGIMFVSGLCFWNLAFAIRAQYPAGQQPAAFSQTQQLINMGALAAFGAAIPLAFANTLVSVALIFCASGMYITRLTRPA